MDMGVFFYEIQKYSGAHRTFEMGFLNLDAKKPGSRRSQCSLDGGLSANRRPTRG
jgi:hypothetical protein